MLSHDPASASEPSDPIPGDHDRLQPVRRSFPVPKRKAAVIENDDEPAEFDRPAWGIWVMLAAAVIMAGAATWITFGRGGVREPKNSSTATALPEPRREISQDPAVEIYFTPSTPVPGEPDEGSEPSFEPAVITPPSPPAERPGAGNIPAPREEDGVFEIRNDDSPK